MIENIKQPQIIDCFVSEINDLHDKYEQILQKQLMFLGQRKKKIYDFNGFLKDCWNIEEEALADLPELRDLYNIERANYIEYNNNIQLKFNF